jgi:hypothetical protein
MRISATSFARTVARLRLNGSMTPVMDKRQLRRFRRHTKLRRLPSGAILLSVYSPGGPADNLEDAMKKYPLVSLRLRAQLYGFAAFEAQRHG